jgi:adenosylcobyric acid synthase
MNRVQRHGGNLRDLARRAGRGAQEILDFSANLNPLGPPEWLRSVVNAHLAEVACYPDPESTDLVEAIAMRFGVTSAEVTVGNGSAELLAFLPLVLDARRAIIPVPAYVDYRAAASDAGLTVETVPMVPERGFQLDLEELEQRLRAGDIVLIGRPNNPTGRSCDAADLRELAGRRSKVTFLVDEAFADFVEDFDSLAIDRPANVVLLRSFTKFYDIPGLRLGCVLADPVTSSHLRQRLPPWSVNSLAQAVGVEVLQDRSDYVRRTRALVAEERRWLLAELTALDGMVVFPGEASFLLVRIDRPGIDAAELAHRTLQQGVAIRACGDYDGLDARYFRVAVRAREDNIILCRALQAALGHRVPTLPRRKPALMFQGTSSGVGKSLLTAAFCRILLEDGHRVAPFKAQNMSLNSSVTRDGGEIGRAQALQALASRLEPDVRMNPILLKPSSDTGAQVMLMGKPVGNMNVEEYMRYKPAAFAQALAAYSSLAEESDVMVLEGAGSPAEVNLKHHDIVNMQMARQADARVVIVGDIDRGGVFAALAGTMDALAEWERRMVSGFVVNRFRGRAALLADALTWTSRATGRPVFGVVPFLHDHGLPEEDSLGHVRGNPTERRSADGVQVVVVHLPHLSNFTDFDALGVEPGVQVRFVREPDAAREVDLLVLPGSKNVASDLEFLRRSGWDRLVAGLAASGTAHVAGICGGLQMLGERVLDPHGIESAASSVPGLGLLPIVTTLEREKTLRRSRAVHLRSGLTACGYEIHHGRSDLTSAAALIRRDDGEVIGVEADSSGIWGTYLHGIFDADELRRWLVDGLRQHRGLAPLGGALSRYDLEVNLQRLADAVRASVDVAAIYKEMRLG